MVFQWGYIQEKIYNPYEGDNTELTLPLAYNTWVLAYANTTNRSSVFVQADSKQWYLTKLWIGRVNGQNASTGIDCMWFTIGY